MNKRKSAIGKLCRHGQVTSPEVHQRIDAHGRIVRTGVTQAGWAIRAASRIDRTTTASNGITAPEGRISSIATCRSMPRFPVGVASTQITLRHGAARTLGTGQLQGDWSAIELQRSAGTACR